MEVEGYITAEDGTKSCPIDVCHSVCCKATHHIPGLAGPCSELTQGGLCGLHLSGKPKGCSQYPRNQADIDMINKQAREAGFTERCQLRVV
jgi:hypothetical protein